MEKPVAPALSIRFPSLDGASASEGSDPGSRVEHRCADRLGDLHRPRRVTVNEDGIELHFDGLAVHRIENAVPHELDDAVPYRRRVLDQRARCGAGDQPALSGIAAVREKRADQMDALLLGFLGGLAPRHADEAERRVEALHGGKQHPCGVAVGYREVAERTVKIGVSQPGAGVAGNRGERTELVKCGHAELEAPAGAEIVLEGYLHPGDEAPEGPFGDHTGYYNEVESFPVFTVTRMCWRDQPIYHSTYTGRPPDEPAVLGVALNEVFVPILQKQFPEIVDFYLPPEGCSYRMAVVSMKKQYPGHAKRVMLGIWSFLRQFMYTKFVVVTDDDVDVRNWQDVIWAMTTRMDPARDTVIIENTPIDYLDFASPVSGLGSKIGFDATNKWRGETNREWGRPISMDPEVRARVDALWPELGLE